MKIALKLLQKTSFYCIIKQKEVLFMTTISLRFDDDMKKQLDEMCEEMGMNLTTFFMIYAKKALRERKIPFEIAAPLDPFYSESNMRQLRQSEEQVKNGQVVVKTMAELEAMAND